MEGVHDKLTEQIARALRHEHDTRFHVQCGAGSDVNFASQGQDKTLKFLQTLPAIRALLATDVKAAYDGDPAARSLDEIIFSYPGIDAVTIQRMAHELYLLDIPIIPRMLTEWAHSRTGIDIHPGANIGPSFFIDHGTGVVIGETCDIASHVKLYQGVTLGALSFPKDAQGNIIRGKKRHPTIEDGVVIYANATVLGGDTVVGGKVGDRGQRLAPTRASPQHRRHRRCRPSRSASAKRLSSPIHTDLSADRRTTVSLLPLREKAAGMRGRTAARLTFLNSSRHGRTRRG